MNRRYTIKILQAIRDGYSFNVHQYLPNVLHITVPNPTYQEDNGNDPNLVLIVQIEQ